MLVKYSDILINWKRGSLIKIIYCDKFLATKLWSDFDSTKLMKNASIYANNYYVTSHILVYFNKQLWSMSISYFSLPNCDSETGFYIHTIIYDSFFYLLIRTWKRFDKTMIILFRTNTNNHKQFLANHRSAVISSTGLLYNIISYYTCTFHWSWTGWVI
jgi:hypothetical protein